MEIHRVCFDGNSEEDSGILSNSNVSSCCEVALQQIGKQNFFNACKCESNIYVIKELKKKIVQLNLKLAIINQENLKVRFELKFQKNELDYLKNCSDWYKKKWSGLKSDFLQLRREIFDKESEIAKCKSLIRNWECENENWLKRIDLIKLKRKNQGKLNSSKIENLESLLNRKEFFLKNSEENLISLRNNYEIEMNDSKMTIDFLKNKNRAFEVLKNEISELHLKNGNLENILGKKSEEIQQLNKEMKKNEKNYSNQLEVKNHALYFDKNNQDRIILSNNLEIEQLNKLVQIKNIYISEKIRRYESSISTLLKKIKDYKISKIVYSKKSDQQQVEINNLSEQWKKIIIANVELKNKLLITSAIADSLKKNNFELETEVLAGRKCLGMFKGNNVHCKEVCENERIDYSGIDLLIEKSKIMDINIYQNEKIENSFNKEFGLVKSHVQNLKQIFLSGR